MTDKAQENKPVNVTDFIAKNAEAIKTMNHKNFQLLDYGCYILPPVVSLIKIHEKFSSKKKEKMKKPTLPSTSSVVKNNVLLNYFNYHIRYLNACSSYAGFYGT